MIARFALIAAALLPAAAFAQARECTIPAILPRPHADLPDEKQPKRVLPIGSYTLAISWSPEFCRTRTKDADNAIQCGGRDGRFGFTLHGLWPDGEGKDWPQYCAPAAILPEALLRQHICATPSTQLLQHEYAKHGTCMGVTPASYFAEATKLYRGLRYPDMDRLSRRPNLTVGAFARTFAAANRLRPTMLRVTVTRKGWLDEVWLCLDRQRRPRACPAHQGGAANDRSLKIWRGR